MSKIMLFLLVGFHRLNCYMPMLRARMFSSLIPVPNSKSDQRRPIVTRAYNRLIQVYMKYSHFKLDFKNDMSWSCDPRKQDGWFNMIIIWPDSFDSLFFLADIVILKSQCVNVVMVLWMNGFCKSLYFMKSCTLYHRMVVLKFCILGFTWN